MLRFLSKSRKEMSKEELNILYKHTQYNLDCHIYENHPINNNCPICKEYIEDLEDIKKYMTFDT